MNPKERMLAIAVGGVFAAIMGYFALSYITGQFSARNAEIAKLEGDIKKSKDLVFAGQLAAKKITQYETRSLPPSDEVTRTLYNDWLLSEIEEAGLIQPDVGFESKVPEGDLFVRQTFSISAQGTLPQVINWLYAFYSVDWLHRITRLRLKPVKESKLLDVDCTVETLSLRRAKETDQLELRPGKRLALPTLQAYHDTIANRNLFGPANAAPKITISGSKDVYIGRAAELTIKGADPDALDKLRYKLVQSPDESAKFDEEKGRLTWSPKEIGKYEFVFEAIDDGLPSKVSNREKVVLNVTEQPPAQKPKLDFDHARFTVLTAVLDLNGKREIWLDVRPLDQTFKLHQGDAFEIGSIKGQVAEIGLHDFSFISDGKLRKLAKGNILEQAQVIADAPAKEEAKSGSTAEAKENNQAPRSGGSIAPKTILTAEDKKAG
jgi:hypothetical protein